MYMTTLLVHRHTAGRQSVLSFDFAFYITDHRQYCAKQVQLYLPPNYIRNL